MLNWLMGKPKVARTAEALYARIVDAARQPAFYKDLEVPDTAEGRFEMVALHLFQALEALKTGRLDPAYVEAFSRHTIEAFVTDMDDCMREMGVGDLTVPKRVKRAAAGFYERTGVYRAALSELDNTALLAALKRYVYQGRDAARPALALAAYMRTMSIELAGAPPETMLSSTQVPNPANSLDASHAL